MKNIKYLFLGLVTLGVFASCESFLADDDINLDPNKPSNVPWGQNAMICVPM